MRSKAFTLIELLVVIGIIALLVSILVPAFQRAAAQRKPPVTQTITGVVVDKEHIRHEESSDEYKVTVKANGHQYVFISNSNYNGVQAGTTYEFKVENDKIISVNRIPVTDKNGEIDY